MVMPSPVKQGPKIHFSLSTLSTNSFLYSFRAERFHFLKLCSSLKETKKQQTISKSPTNSPQRLLNLNLKSDDQNESDTGADGDNNVVKGTILAVLLLVGVFGAIGYFYKDQINVFLNQFSGFIEGYGPVGYALLVAFYAGLEVAASIAFLIARYFACERILKLVEGNKKFLGIDKAIGENGFKVVTLLRLSPLLPFFWGIICMDLLLSSLCHMF